MDARDILRMVVACDARTSVANAFRRAFGLPEAWDVPRAPLVVSAEAYSGMMECFANRESPMDGRRRRGC